MIERDHPDLSIGQQCAQLSILRSSFYYTPQGETDRNFALMRRGVLYLVAIMDWRTRMVPSWRISNTQDADFCVEALNEAVAKFGPP